MVVDLELMVGAGAGVGLEEVGLQQLGEEQQLPPKFHLI